MVLRLGWFILNGAGIRMVAAMRLVVLMQGRIMHWRSHGHFNLHHKTRDRVTECHRGARGEHAKQVEQGGKPPSPGARRSRQANEHGGKLIPIADSAKMPMAAFPSHSACPIQRQCGLTLGDLHPKFAPPW
jgi:hypothetical protein